MKRNGKYNARKTTNAHGTFDSRLELHRYYVLKEAEEKGLISDLRTQVPYIVIPKQTETILTATASGKTKLESRCAERATKYLADFVYVKDGKTIIEDTKSEATRKKESYIMKRKLMRFMGNPIREVYHSTEEI